MASFNKRNQSEIFSVTWRVLLATLAYANPLQIFRCCGRYVRIMIKHLAILMGFLCSAAFAQDIEVEVDDCGPLGREGLGVVFGVKPHGPAETYFAKGSALEVCPRLITARRVVGYEEPYCRNHKPVHAQECEQIKVFVIKEYVFE